MQIDEFLELARKRRSIRRFKPGPIPDEYIEKIIEAAHWAMSGANGQPWEFIVVKSQETKNKIAELKREFSPLVFAMEQVRVPELRHPFYARATDPSTAEPLDALVNAPVLIVVCGDPRTVLASVLVGRILPGGETTFHANMANAVHMIHLAAAALGLGAQWHTVSEVWEGKLKALLGVPDEYRIYTLVPIGYPAYEPAPPYRREISEILHFERYDMSKYRSHEEILKYIAKLRQLTTPAYATRHSWASSPAVK